MPFGKLEVFDEYAKDALKKFGMSESCTAKRLQVSENITYLVKNKATGANESVLRISRPGYHSLEELYAEIAWLKEIKKYTPIRVASPIKGENGGEVQLLHCWMEDSTYAGVMYEFLEGKQPDEASEEDMVRDFKKLGEITAWLHRQSRMWNEASKLKRGVMDYDTIIGDHPMWGRWQDAADLQADGREILERTSDVIRGRLQTFGKSRAKFGLIHADLRMANLLEEKDQLKVIDFDDCGFGWYLHDLAGAVSFIEDKPYLPQLVASWIEGYRKVEPMGQEEIDYVHTFIMQRRLQLLAWITSHYDSDPVKELGVGFTDATVGLAENYLRKYESSAIGL